VDLTDGFKGRPVGELILKGKTEAMMAWQPLTETQFNHPSTAAYQAAYEMLRSEDPGAYQSFAALVGEYGEDPLASFHLKRLLGGESTVSVMFEEK